MSPMTADTNVALVFANMQTAELHRALSIAICLRRCDVAAADPSWPQQCPAIESAVKHTGILDASEARLQFSRHVPHPLTHTTKRE